MAETSRHQSNDLPCDVDIRMHIMIVGQFVPCSKAKVNVVLVAARAGILHGSDDRVSLSTNSIAATSVGDLDLAPAVRPRNLVLHPVVAESSYEGRVGVLLTAGAKSTSLIIFCTDARVTRDV